MSAQGETLSVNQRIVAAHDHWLRSMLPGTFGYYLLQLGGWGQSAWLKASPIKFQIGLAPQIALLPPSPMCRVIATYETLPFGEESLDAVVVAEDALTTCQSPKRLFAEIYACLMSGGKVFILGLNRSSCIKPTKLQRELIDLGYAVSPIYSLIQRPWMKSGYWSDKLNHLEARLWPSRAGCYAMFATKVVERVIPIQPLSRVSEKKSF